MNKKIKLPLLIAAMAAGVGVFYAYKSQFKLSVLPLDVHFTGHVQGKVKTCGCSLQDIGGVARWVTFFAQQSKDALILDYGDFVVDPEISDKESKRNLFLELAQQAPYDAVNLVPRDRAVLQNPEALPFVSFSASEPNIPKSKTFTKAGMKFWITGISNDIAAPVEELRKEISELEVDVIPVVLSNFPMSENTALLAQLNLRPLLLVGHDKNYDRFFKKKVGNSLYMTGGDLGRHVARTTLKISFVGKKLADIDLDQSAFINMGEVYSEREPGATIKSKIEEWEKLNGPIKEQ